MILVDTSVWIDHLHKTDRELVGALDRSVVVQHPMVIGELSLGSIRNRAKFLELLSNLPSTPAATHDEVNRFVEQHALFGQGLSLVDAHLLASVMLAPGTRMWTRDKRLAAAAERLGVAHQN